MDPIHAMLLCWEVTLFPRRCGYSSWEVRELHRSMQTKAGKACMRKDRGLLGGNEWRGRPVCDCLSEGARHVPKKLATELIRCPALGRQAAPPRQEKIPNMPHPSLHK